MLLQLKDIHTSFTNSRNETFDLLRGVSLDIEEGSITALMGGNGSGKTTLFNIISGFHKKYSGSVIFDGHNLKRLPPHAIASLGIGRLFQGGQLIPGLTLLENLQLGAPDTNDNRPLSSLLKPRQTREADLQKKNKAIESLIQLFGEGNKYLDKLYDDGSSFSYGAQRLLSLARLMIGDHKLLLLDEPTSGVNQQFFDTIKSIITQIASTGKTIFFIEHNTKFIRDITDSCAILSDGVITEHCPTDNMAWNVAKPLSYNTLIEQSFHEQP